jgi:glycosyltransferase involved in cell wall biosynthesis
MPRVSVLMSVHNGARYVETALDSVLAQTFSDFEFVIVDDGSTDETPAILARYADPRIVGLRNEVNLGLTKSLNRGLEVARGEYVARQDADDLSLPGRLACQVQFLKSHPDISLVGTSYVQIDEQGQELSTVAMPAEPDQIREMLFYTPCFCHGSVMGRHADLQAIGGYDERFVAAQDMDLWLRLAERYQLANLPAPLYGFRMHAASVTGRSRSHQRQMGHQATAEAMARCLSQPTGWRPSALTLGRFHFSQAMQALEDGRRDRARQQLILARTENPRLDHDAGYLARMAIYRAFELGPAGTSRHKSTEDVRAGLRFVHGLFDLVPKDLELLQAKRSWAAAELHAAYAFAAFEAGSRTRTVAHCLRTWGHEPSRLGRRGLLSIFGWSLVRLRPGGGKS